MHSTFSRGLTVVGRTLGASLRHELPKAGASFAERASIALGASCARSFVTQRFSETALRGFAVNVNPVSSDSAGVRQHSTKVDDSHDDFKPVSNTTASTDVKTYIEKCISDHKIFVFMKGVPEAPQCGFSNMTCKVLQHYNVSFGAANVLEDQDLREGIKEYSKWPTIPQVYVDGEFIGGSDILMSSHQSGELAEILGVKNPEEKKE